MTTPTIPCDPCTYCEHPAGRHEDVPPDDQELGALQCKDAECDCVWSYTADNEDNLLWMRRTRLPGQ